MSPKLQKVCNYYLKGMSMREALLKVGYSDAYASHNSTKFLHNREVQRYVRDRQKAEADAALVDAIYLLDNLKKIIDSPNSTNREKSEALKILNERIRFKEEIEAKIKQIESQQDKPKEESNNITININEASQGKNG